MAYSFAKAGLKHVRFDMKLDQRVKNGVQCCHQNNHRKKEQKRHS